MTDAADPAASEDIAAQWRSMGDGLEEAGKMLAQVVFGSEAGWTGQAADVMRYRLGQVAQWSTNTGQGFTAASSAVWEQSAAVGEAKTRMPEPVPYDPGQIFDQAMADGLLGIIALPQRLHSQKQKHDAAYDEAVLVVTARDGQLAVGAATIPAFTAPPVLSDDGGARPPDAHDRRPPGGGPGGGPDAVPGGGFGPVPGGAGPGQAGPPPGPGPTGPVLTGPVRPDAGLTTPGSHPTGLPGIGQGWTGGGGGQGSGVPGGGQGFGPGSGLLPGAGFGAGGGFGPGAGAGPGSGGGGRGIGPGAGGSGRGPGGAAGMGGPGAVGAEAAAGGRGAGGARGGAGMGGMPMGGGRGQGDEDAEHQRPTWLQEDDPDALFGTDESTAPPVIGAD